MKPITSKTRKIFAAMMIVLTILVSACSSNNTPPATLTVTEQNAATVAQQANRDGNQLDASAPKISAKPKAFGSVLDTSDFEYFMQFTQGFTDPALHGALIDRLDTLYLNIQRMPNGGTISTTADEVMAVWFGNYTDEDPLKGVLTAFLMDHDTGVSLLLPSSTVTLETGFAYVVLHDWTGETVARAGTPALATSYVSAAGFVPNAEATNLNASCKEEDFTELDKVANANPDAQIKNGWHSVVQAIAGQTVVWVKTGMVGLGWAEICSDDGISAYVAKLSGPLEVMYPFNGFNLKEVYPGYESLPSVTASAAPAESLQTVANSTFADLVNKNRQSNDLWTSLSLLPSATHPAGTYETKWNTIILTSGDVGGANLVPIDFFETSDGFRAVYFVTTDGTSTFEANSAVITLSDVFSPAEAFVKWWK